MNWSTLAALVASGVGLVLAIRVIAQERTTLHRLERITAVVTALPVGSESRQKMETIQASLVDRYFWRFRNALDRRTSRAFITAIACFTSSLFTLGTGVAQRTFAPLVGPQSGILILIGATLLPIGLVSLVIAFTTLRRSRGPRVRSAGVTAFKP